MPLSPGNYSTVVQAWDNCGTVTKASVNFTVNATGLRPARFLYLTTSSAQDERVFGYVINPQTGALSPLHQRFVSGVTGAFAISSDMEGYRLYVMPLAQFTNDDNAAAYFIDRRNGALSPVPGSPSFVGFGVRTMAVHLQENSSTRELSTRASPALEFWCSASIAMAHSRSLPAAQF